jgi:hypothetical protein
MCGKDNLATFTLAAGGILLLAGIIMFFMSSSLAGDVKLEYAYGPGIYGEAVGYAFSGLFMFVACFPGYVCCMFLHSVEANDNLCIQCRWKSQAQQVLPRNSIACSLNAVLPPHPGHLVHDCVWSLFRFSNEYRECSSNSIEHNI